MFMINAALTCIGKLGVLVMREIDTMQFLGYYSFIVCAVKNTMNKKVDLVHSRLKH